MKWCKDNIDLWKEVIETISYETKRSVFMIEKDTIQSIFLYELSKSSVPFVFKGGTSLSKVFGLIDRFSEDIDLSSSKKLTDSEKKYIKKLIIDTASNINLTLTNFNNIKSRYDYNKYIFKYESLFDDNELEIIVETSFYQEVYPVVFKNVNSFIGVFFKEKNIKLPISFKASFFDFAVQSLERTFIDKIFAICDYKIENMMDRDSRHLYDIAKIIPYILFDENLKKLIILVRNDRKKSKNNPSSNEIYNITNMLKEIISSRFYENDYNNITKKLLYEKYGYDEAINNGIAIVANKEIF